MDSDRYRCWHPRNLRSVYTDPFDLVDVFDRERRDAPVDQAVRHPLRNFDGLCYRLGGMIKR